MYFESRKAKTKVAHVGCAAVWLLTVTTLVLRLLSLVVYIRLTNSVSVFLQFMTIDFDEFNNIIPSSRDGKMLSPAIINSCQSLQEKMYESFQSMLDDKFD